MIALVLKRLGLGLVTLLVIITISFFLQRLAPGGPFDAERAVDPAVRAAQEKEWGLDRPLPVQFGLYLKGLLALPPDFKRSMTRPDFEVREILTPRLKVSLSLGAAVLVFSLLVGIPLGLWAGVRRGGAIDAGAMFVAVVGISVPNFVLGPLLKWIFALELGWLPESRWVSPASMVLPTLSLSAIYVATIARLVRSGTVETLGETYVRTARAKGLSETRVLLRHVLPGALLPLVSYLGPAAAGLAVGSVVVERVFNIPGLGNEFVESAFNRDYTMVMGTVITYSAILILMNLLSDLLLMAVDPRVREQR